MECSPADRAEHADQSLRQHAMQRRYKVIRLYAHIQKPPDHVDDDICVNSRENQMARESRLNSDLRCFLVANLANHDLVRIVTQNRTQSTREGQTFLLVDRDLSNAMQLILNRVFNRDDFIFFVSDFVQGGIKRRRLSRSCWSGHQHHPVRLGNVMTKFSKIVWIESNHVQIEVAKSFIDLLFVENTNNRVFAVHGRHNRNTEVNIPPFVAHAKTAILRHAPLSNVQLRHNLDTGDQGLMIGQIDRINFRVHLADESSLDL